MRHVLYAQFPSRDDASAAIRDLATEGVARARCRIVVGERPPRPSELDVALSDARRAVAFGAIMGSVVGAAFGVVLAGPLQVTSLGAVATSLFTALAGCGVGSLGGVLSGSMTPDRALDPLGSAMEPGSVMASVEVEALTIEERVERVFLAHGADQVRRSFV